MSRLRHRLSPSYRRNWAGGKNSPGWSNCNNVTIHDEPSVKSHIANSCYRSKSNKNPIHTSNNSKVQRIITPLLDIV